MKLSPSLRYNAFNGIEWSFQMKDLGFNEFGELAGGENDEENLNKLGDNDFLKLRRSNALPAIYAHLASLPQADRLAQFRRDGVGEVPQATN